MAQTLAQLIRAKYPGTYDNLSDQELEAKVRAKYPGVYDQVPSTPAQPQQTPAPATATALTPTVQQMAVAGPSAMAGANGPQGPLTGILHWISQHPVEAGAMLGGAVASPLTGGASVPAAMAAAGLGAAGGAGLGSIVNAAKGGTNGPTTAPGVLGTMAAQGMAGAAGEGLGQGANALLKGAGKLVYRTALRPSLALQRDFGDIASAGLARRIPVSDAGAKAAHTAIGQDAGTLAGLLATKDAERPAVAGLLPVPKGIPLPRATGVLLRENPAIASPWDQRSVYGSMVAPAEVADALSSAKADLSHRALGQDATNELAGLKERFLTQHPAPMSLQQTQALKEAEQGLANTAYRAMNNGAPVNAVDAQFHRGVASGARQAIESRVPQAAPLNTNMQQLIGIRNAIENARMRNMPGLGFSPRSMLGDFAPNAASRLSILADQLGGTPLAPTALRLLAALLAGSQ